MELVNEALETDQSVSGKENLLEKKVSSLQEKVKEHNESIRYASVIQQAILPNISLFLSAFNDAFVFYEPKDLISGDFYWFYRHKNTIYFAVGDCTGHGVPGAMVNMAANSFLQQIIKQKGVYNPAKIITLLDKELSTLLNINRSVGETYDGLDIGLCRFDLDTKKGHYCGAGRPLYLVRKGNLIEFDKGKSSIGYFKGNKERFNSVYFDLRKGDNFYLFSDGYTDQFGGENIKKFNRKRFRTLLQSIQSMTLDKQEKELRLSFDNWKGKHEQIDDVCVLGVQV
jgi:serine phosphatase RsbU (regulator of sigma subunit)